MHAWTIGKMFLKCRTNLIRVDLVFGPTWTIDDFITRRTTLHAQRHFPVPVLGAVFNTRETVLRVVNHYVA
jgi:hypothetical protein